MKGHRGLVTTLPENFSFDSGSTSSDAAIDTQMSWNTMQTSSQNRVPDYRISSNEANMQWSSGETSSSAGFALTESQYDPSNIPSLDSADVNANINQTAQTQSLPQDLNMCSEFGNNEDEDCHVIERPNTSTEKMPSTESENQAGALDGRRISCKRKEIEPHVGQSSGVGSSNLVTINEAEQANPRLRLGVGGALSANPLSLSGRGSAAAAAAESSRRNFRLRFNGSHQQDHTPGGSSPFLTESDADVSSSRHSSRLILRNRLFDLAPSPPVENGTPQGPSSSRNTQSRWSGASSSSGGAGAGSSGERDILEESTSRNVLRSISEHPMFVPASEMGSSSRQPTNWNLGGANSSAPPIRSNRSCPQYPRRLSEIVRRSLLSTAGTEAGGSQSSGSGHAVRPSSAAAVSEEAALPSGSNSRAALLERHIDGAFGLPYSLRGLAAAGEGRSSMMSEQIRHVLDLMRRGEGLRVEDVMLLDHSVFFGMADIHDRHRDMRLDVDNMSYEELLALEDRIGNVCTGLNEEKIMGGLKQRKYVAASAEDQAQTEPCSICREEYNDGEDLGTLECEHDFHKDCIKQWLMQKNLCPICKTTGLST
ncbi:hypothetical protein ABFS83_14G258600 [Erythranthe nasuta]